MPDTMTSSLSEFFPPSPRVFYTEAPLAQVVCQLRFPQILRIDSQPPAEFQERIRGLYPLLERAQVQLPIDIPQEMAHLIGMTGAAGAFAFKTEDRLTTLSLASDSLSLATTQYRRWENFSTLLMPAIDALIDIYRPSFFQRVGLRYVNMIDRERLGLAKKSWSKLLRREVVGELYLAEMEKSAVEFARNIRLNGHDGFALFFQHGLARRRVLNAPPQPASYRLDFDFYREGKTEADHVKPTIDILNSIVGRAFRWTISDVLHNALKPTPI